MVQVCSMNIIIFSYITIQVFADLDMCYMLDPDCVDKGEYVDHGTFGEIFHGAVYPSVHATVCTVFIPVSMCQSDTLYIYICT